MATMPAAARRSPYGSLEPEGGSPQAKAATMLSTFSAVASSAPGTVSGGRAAGRVGQELLPDGLGHLGMMPFHERVRLAHDALQVGELAHHDRHLVGLGQPGGFERALPGFAGSAASPRAR